MFCNEKNLFNQSLHENRTYITDRSLVIYNANDLHNRVTFSKQNPPESELFFIRKECFSFVLQRGTSGFVTTSQI